MRQVILFTHDDGETESELPARFSLCPVCEGCGTDRGAFTSSEWAEQDDDFKADYLAGRYDRPCEHCRGHAGRVLVVDRAACDPELLAMYDREQEDERDYQAMCAAECRMGC